MGYIADQIIASADGCDAEQLANRIRIAEGSPVQIATRYSDLWVTPAQYEKLRDLWERSGETLTVSWSQFLRNVRVDIGSRAADNKVDIVVPNWCGMYIGITPDGRSHS